MKDGLSIKQDNIHFTLTPHFGEEVLNKHSGHNMKTIALSPTRSALTGAYLDIEREFPPPPKNQFTLSKPNISLKSSTILYTVFMFGENSVSVTVQCLS